MSSGGLPISSQTIAGYMIYWQERGATPEEALARAEAFHRFGTQSPQAFYQAALYAAEALSLTAQAQAAQNQPQFRPGSLVSELGEEVFGLRLRYSYVDVRGIAQQSSVVVNVGPNATMADLQRYVDRIAETGTRPQTSMSPLPAISWTPITIDQVMPGGYGSAIETIL